MRYLNIICTINQTGYGATRYMCMANINYGDQTLGEREVTCRANKHDTKKYIPNNYEKIYITSDRCLWIKWSNKPGQSACSAYTGLTNEVLPNLYCWTFQEKNIQGCRFFYTTHSKMFLALIYSGCTKNRNERQKHFSVGHSSFQRE